MTETITRNTTQQTVVQQPRLLDQVRAAIRTRHYSLRTEQAYTHWIKRYILYHGKRHPLDMGAQEIETFLSALATERSVSASTQNQALAALLFLYREVLDRDLPWLEGITRAKPSKHLPTVLTQAETAAMLRHLPADTNDLIIRLLYGTGMPPCWSENTASPSPWPPCATVFRKPATRQPRPTLNCPPKFAHSGSSTCGPRPRMTKRTSWARAKHRSCSATQTAEPHRSTTYDGGVL